MSGQPQGWRDTDTHLHGVYNRDIELTANVVPGTKVSLRMAAGAATLLEGVSVANLPFDSYPAVHTGLSGDVTASGIDPNLIGLQYLQFVIPVREPGYYKELPPVTVEFSFEFRGLIVFRKYTLSLTVDQWALRQPNVHQQNDLAFHGVPFLPAYAGWTGAQPITGEYIYTSPEPPVVVSYTGYWTTCFSAGLEAELNFEAFQNPDVPDSPYPKTRGAIELSLDLCRAGLTGMRAKLQHFSSKFQPVQIGRQTCYLMSLRSGSFVISTHYQPTEILFTRECLSPSQIQLLLAGKSFHDYVEYRNDKYGFQRVLVQGTSFWRVLAVKHPVPASGGTYNGPFPVEFVNGVVNHIAENPNCFEKLGALPE